MTTPAVADVENKTVTYEGITYDIQALAEDNFTVLVKGIPVGRIVWSFGAPNGVPEGDSGTSEDTLWYIGEAWFAATAPELEGNTSPASGTGSGYRHRHRLRIPDTGYRNGLLERL